MGTRNGERVGFGGRRGLEGLDGWQEDGGNPALYKDEGKGREGSEDAESNCIHGKCLIWAGTVGYGILEGIHSYYYYYYYFCISLFHQN